MLGYVYDEVGVRHVAVDEERETSSLARPRHHALVASNAQRRATLTDEHVSAWCLGFPL